MNDPNKRSLNMLAGREKFFVGLALFLISMSTYGENGLPPGFDVAEYRSEAIASRTNACVQLGIYPEIKGNLPLRKDFCQCVYEDYYAKFSDAELKSDLVESMAILQGQKTPSESENRKLLRECEKNNQRHVESEKFCMNKLKVSVTISPKACSK
jgi:hypothetical protein